PYKGITLMMPVPRQGGYSYGVLLLIISEKNFSQYRNRSDEINHNIVVLDQEDNILAQSNNNLKIDRTFLMNVLSDNNRSSSQIEIENVTYMINSQKSKKHGLRFINLTPLDDILFEITQLKTKSLFLVIFVFIFEVGLIILIMRMN